MVSSVGVLKSRNLTFRLLLLAFVCVPFFYVHTFYEHFRGYLTGSMVDHIIRDQWGIVLLSVLLFLVFLIPLSFRRKAKWAEYGLVGAFFVSLFVEMYGIPFTVLFAQKWFYQADAALPERVAEFGFLGVGFSVDLPMVWSAVLMIVGTVLVVVGWITLYRSIKKKDLVTSGIYSYSRHPQYFGFILVIVGWLVGWPTILTLVLAPILIYKYVRASQAEEKEVPNLDEYQKYKETVPLFI